MTDYDVLPDALTLEEAAEQVALASRRLGLLHLAFAGQLVEEFGEEEGKRLAKRAIDRYSSMVGSAKRELALARGLEPSAVSFFEMSDLPSIGMHERVEQVEVEGEKRYRAYGCIMGRVWRKYGANELGRIYCNVDPASSMEFDRRCKLVHTKALPDGDDYCEFAMRPTTEEDLMEFDSEDTDWSAIEKRTGGQHGSQ